jgi:hypothetical protein
VGSSKVNHGKKESKASETTMIGTYLSVGVVGLVILIVYFIIYGLYMARV